VTFATPGSGRLGPMTSHPSPRYSVALFDLDGTLCDPGTGIADAVRHGLAQVGIREDDDAVLRGFVGPPLEHSLRDRYQLSPAQVARAVAAYREHYVAAGIFQYRPYPGIPEVLGRLAEQGVRLGVVTAKAQAIAEQALRGTGLIEQFEHVAGRDPDVVVVKAVTLRDALAAMGCAPREAVMIGDREHDVHAARDNHIDSIGVLYGYGSRDELVGAGATHLAESPESVEALVLGRP